MPEPPVEHSDQPPGQDDETLAEQLWSVARMLRHRTRESTAPLGITPGQARAIRVLAGHGRMRISDLSHHLRIAPRSTTEVVDGLEELGLARREPDPDDRRAVVVTLAPAGEQLTTELRRARNEEAEVFFSALSRPDRVHLSRILTLLSRGSGPVGPGPDPFDQPTSRS
jgi:DNA-binding MarR family transcriptional regulator